jgi:DNA-binding winged helix-turn-helix (wHTH) protein
VRFRFADCTFDVETRALLRAGRPLALSENAAAVLAALLQKRPVPVPNVELASAVWPRDTSAPTRIPGLILELRGAIEPKGEAEILKRTSTPDGYAFAGTAMEDRRPVISGVGYRYRLYWDDREIALQEGENVIGRDRDAELRVAKGDVSRRHARVLVSGDRVTLEDLGSSNGTFCNDHRVETPLGLSDGDRITVGPVHLIFRARPLS